MLRNASMRARLSLEKYSLFCHWDSRKGDNAFEADLVLAALKKQALAVLWPGWLCTCAPGWLWERAWCQVDLPSVLGPTCSWEGVKLCLQLWCELLGGLEGHLGAALGAPEPGSQQGS